MTQTIEIQKRKEKSGVAGSTRSGRKMTRKELRYSREGGGGEEEHEHKNKTREE